MFGINWQRITVKTLLTLLVVGMMTVGTLTSCSVQNQPSEFNFNRDTSPIQGKKIAEVSPPATVQALRQALDIHQPQVKIISPRSNEVLTDNTVKVQLQVEDLPIFQDAQWQLGPHLHLILDNRPYESVYSLDQPFVFSDLEPGTHTLRVFPVRPWHESFKNEGAYAQTTFHVFTPTPDNQPQPELPLLTYSRPKGSYGAEPIMLDFYLNNAPLHLVAQENPEDEVTDWRIRVTINGDSFVLDQWQPIYLKGFKPGKNWVKLEFLDEQGNPVDNEFNTTVRVINYEPNGQDTLSKLVRGELKASELRGIVDPEYAARTPVPAPVVMPTPEPAPPAPEIEPVATPTVEIPAPVESETPLETPETIEEPVADSLEEIEEVVEESGEVPAPESVEEPVAKFPEEIEEVVEESGEVPAPESVEEPVTQSPAEIEEMMEESREMPAPESVEEPVAESPEIIEEVAADPEEVPDAQLGDESGAESVEVPGVNSVEQSITSTEVVETTPAPAAPAPTATEEKFNISQFFSDLWQQVNQWIKSITGS